MMICISLHPSVREIRAQRGKVTCPGSHSYQGTEPAPDSILLCRVVLCLISSKMSFYYIRPSQGTAQILVASRGQNKYGLGLMCRLA